MENYFNINIKKSLIFRAINLEKFFLFRFSGLFKKAFFLISLFFLIFYFTQLSSMFSSQGWFILFFSLCLIFWQIEVFFNSKIKNLKPEKKLSDLLKNPSHYNLFDFFDFESAKAVNTTFRKEKTALSLIKNIFQESEEVRFIFMKIGISFEEIFEAINKQYPGLKDYSPKDKFEKIIIDSARQAYEKNQITCIDILISIIENETLIKKIFFDRNIEKQDIEEISGWFREFNEDILHRKRFWEYENLIKKGFLAKDWTSGYTLTLDKYSTDWTARLRKKGFQKVIGHEKEIKNVERVLSRREINNVLMVGEGGVGRKTMIFELARKSFCGESLPEVNYKRIVKLDIPFLLAQTKSDDEAENLLDVIFKEVFSSGNIILVIDDFHNFIGTETKPGKLDISGIISSYLHFPQFQIIGITDPVSYRQNIERNLSMSSYFEKIEISEISEKETLKILQKFSLILEKKYKKVISYSALKSVISYSSKYLTDSFFPKKAMDLLDGATIHLTQSGRQVLLTGDIAEIVSQKTNMPIGEIDEKEKNILLNLEELIHQRVIAQEEAIKDVSSALRRSRADISERKKPMGSFLFLGPTGVGKTETAKALSQFYFGSENKMIRVDMSEFQNLSDIQRLIGSSENEGFLTTKVKESPFALILLDEIEKAHPDILNLFLQVLDEGHLTDGFGRKVDFKNSIIIATSNAGSQFILENINRISGWENFKQELLNNLFKNNIFRPEFINRFDSVVVFKPLSKSNLLEIVELILNNIKQGMKKKGIIFHSSQELKKSLVEIGYSPEFGARELKRTIQNKVESPLASAFLSNSIKKGDNVQVNSQSFEIEKLNNIDI
jgi:ATP-dependent Clp protease ATP-binding subunit ClpC